MSARARKSTGTRPSPIKNSSLRNNTSSQSIRRTRATNSNLSVLQESSSDSEAPTQRLRPRNIPGTSGISSQASVSTALASDSDDFDDESSQRVSTQRRRIIRNESTSETTSDSDAPEHEKSIRKANTSVRKGKGPVKPVAKGKQNKPVIQRVTTDSISQIDSTPSSSRVQTQFNSKNLSSLVNKCVYFCLIMDQKKHAIKKSDIVRHVFSNQDTKLYSAVIEGANNVLKKVYGIEIIALEKRKGEYLLINYLDRDLSVQQFMELSTLDVQKHGLIFYLLTVIYMNGNFINESELGQALKPLGIDINSKSNPIFGNVSSYIKTDLIKQMYLEYRCISKDPPDFEYSWGVRAKQEVDKKDLLEFFCQIDSEYKPEDWILQYKDALEATKEREDKNRTATNRN